MPCEMQMARMYPDSARGYYAASVPLAAERAPLAANVQCDVCIVGGGYTGLSAARTLSRLGARTILLEARRVAFEASGRNGGQIHPGFRKEQRSLEAWLGQQHARDLWTIAEDSKRLIRSIIEVDDIIDCDLSNGLIVAAHNARAMALLQSDAEHLRSHYGFPIRTIGASTIAALIGTGIYAGGTLDESGGHLHPLKFALGLASAAERYGAEIHENSRVLGLAETHGQITIKTEAASVIADMAILACDAHSGELAPELAPYIAWVDSFLVATEPLQDVGVLPCNAAVADTRHVLDYYRKSADRRLLFAGRESYFRPPEDIVRLVRPRMARVFPSLANVRIDYAWKGTVGITATRMPHFGRIGRRVLFGHGYSGHGLALSVMGGKLLAEAATGSSEGFEILARVPAQTFPGGRWLRKPMISAALSWYRIIDAL